MTSVLFLAFLLFQLEQPLLFGFPLLAGVLLTFELVFFILLLQSLLRLGADARFFKLLMRVSLTALRIIRLLLDLCFDRRAESQVIEVSQDKGVYLRVGRLRAEYYSAYREPLAVQLLEHAHPERLFKKDRQLGFK